MIANSSISSETIILSSLFDNNFSQNTITLNWDSLSIIYIQLRQLHSYYSHRQSCDQISIIQHYYQTIKVVRSEHTQVKETAQHNLTSIKLQLQLQQLHCKQGPPTMAARTTQTIPTTTARKEAPRKRTENRTRTSQKEKYSMVQQKTDHWVELYLLPTGQYHSWA